jgi:hypothetical protein
MKRVSSLLGFMVLFLFSTSLTHAGLFDAWANKVEIRFAGYNQVGTLTNFPVAVQLDAATGVCQENDMTH